jgi:hypothetical protein
MFTDISNEDTVSIFTAEVVRVRDGQGKRPELTSRSKEKGERI